MELETLILLQYENVVLIGVHFSLSVDLPFSYLEQLDAKNSSKITSKYWPFYIILNANRKRYEEHTKDSSRDVRTI